MFTFLFEGSHAINSASLLAVAVISAVLWQFHLAWKNPLNDIPGPWSARFTNLKLKKETLAGDRTVYVHSLHQRYGPIVRVSPKEVSVAHVDASREIYKIGSRFNKTAWYRDLAGSTKKDSLFTMLDPKAHAHHRQHVSWFFSEKHIAQLEPCIVKNVQLGVQRIREDLDTQKFVDVFKWFYLMATNVVGEAAFGTSLEVLESRKVNQHIQDLQMAGKGAIVRSEFPTLFSLTKYIAFGMPKEIARSRARLGLFVQESVDRYWKQLRADPGNAKPTLLTKEYDMVEEGIMLPDQLVRDALGYLIAGSDTTSNTLTYAVWELARHPEIESSLSREVATLPNDFCDEDLKQLELLEGVLNETLRLHSVIPGGLPRVVPPGGIAFCGHYLPPGTIVGIPAFTMHRHSSIWKDAETFDPSRWNSPTKEMKEHFLPFGGGSRICIGMHFARLEIRHALAEFYRTIPGGVKVSTAEGFTDLAMTPKTYFLVEPEGRRCLVERRDGTRVTP